MISRPLQIAIFLLLVGVLAGGIYMNRLKQHEVARNRAKSPSVPVSGPAAGPEEKIDVMIAYDDDGVLKKEQLAAALPEDPAARAKEVLRTLIRKYLTKPSPHILGDGSDVREVYMVEGGLCVVDLNAAFADGHRSGVMVEDMTIASLVESLSLNVPQIKQVKFLVAGKERETLAGHADLGVMYDPSQMHELVTELRTR